MPTTLAAALGGITNLTHGFIYFAPEAAARYTALGLAPEQQYFASRAAPMGPVTPGVVIATFFNFNPELVHAAIPAAWSVADPAAIQTARMDAAGEVLQRCCPDLDAADIAEANDIAGALIESIGFEGKPLAAANAAVPEPADPLTRLWQRITVIREWRGDIHVAALVAAPVTAVEALVLHAATDQVPRSALIGTRMWSDDAWAAGVANLVIRGLVNEDESFTDAGRAFREEIEATTNAGTQPVIDQVGDEAVSRFVDLLKPMRRGLLEGGAFANMGR